MRVFKIFHVKVSNMKKVFLHGWSFSSEIWDKTTHNKENAIFIDLPFHGANKKKYGRNILHDFVNEVFSIISSQKEDVCLVGWSLGASVSSLVALKKPENLKKLVLIGFSPKFLDKELGHDPKAVKAFIFSLKKDFERTVYNFRKTATDSFFSNIPIPEKAGSIKILQEFINLDLRDILKDIDISTVLIHGKGDKIISYKGSIFTFEKIKNSSLHILNTNHAPFLSFNIWNFI